jgi:hypothetical protein
MPLSMTTTTAPPSTASITRPLPPNRLVPPMTGRADGVQQHVAAAGVRVHRVGPGRGQDAADGGHRRADHEARDLDAVDRMPARRAASVLPPTAYRCRPNAVRPSTNVQKMSSTAMIRHHDRARP